MPRYKRYQRHLHIGARKCLRRIGNSAHGVIAPMGYGKTTASIGTIPPVQGSIFPGFILMILIYSGKAFVRRFVIQSLEN